MKKTIEVLENESVLESIKREDVGEYPIINFPVIKVDLHADYNPNEDDTPIRLESVAQSIRRGDHPHVELGVATGSINGQYKVLQNMKMVEMFFGPHIEDFSSRITIWNTDKGKVCGVDAYSHDVLIGEEHWTVWSSMRQGHDLSRCLECTCYMKRESDQLQIPCVVKGGVFARRHTENAEKDAEVVQQNLDAAGDMMEEQVQLMDQWSQISMEWRDFQRLLLKTLPEYDPDKGQGSGKARRETVLDKIRKHCGSAGTALDCMVGFTTFIAQESSARVYKGKTEEEVRFLSTHTGLKFRQLQKIHTAILDHILALNINLEEVDVEEVA